MPDINKQRFLTELSKLLSFMSARDRQVVMDKYTAMLDEAADEQELLRELGTPTKVAISLASEYVPSPVNELDDAEDDTAEDESLPPAEAEEEPSSPDEIIEIEGFTDENDYSEAAPIPEAEEEISEIPGQADLFLGSAEEETAPEIPFSEPSVNEDEPLQPSLFPQADFMQALPLEDDFAQEDFAQNDFVQDLQPSSDEIPSAAQDSEQVFAPDSVLPEIPEIDVSAKSGDLPDFFTDGDAPTPQEDTARYKPAAVTIYTIFAIIIGLPISLILILIGVPFIAVGGGLIAGAAYAFVSLAALLGLVSDILACAGAALLICAMGLVLLWFGLWVSISLARLFIGGCILRLGRKICMKKEGA